MEKVMINLSHIKKIRLSLNERCNDFVYKPKKSFLGFVWRKEGIYCTYTDERVDEKYLERNNRELRFKTVYFKPHIIVSFTERGDRNVFYYDSESEAKYVYHSLSLRMSSFEFK